MGIEGLDGSDGKLCYDVMKWGDHILGWLIIETNECMNGLIFQ